MRVSIVPGAYAFTVMLCLPNSCALRAPLQSMNVEEDSSVNGIPAACVRPRTANLDAPYAQAILVAVFRT